ncbi:hypothetical protein PAAG_06338 [Paracoccidioides lutzii Pb01]|uniref:Uncharacterized protein n=1 Tax=Paracoccidioides lutzii (strain ATCC MYA-826 / Pb01) TaxID=502779 RepID=C1H6E7_PARBA|nr:hypothetical protein PAAG_06338 [Paracoccidioides lutzii Pb01]EEH35291.1 hypothetical protein PAAG_06338 [Paracoccidioides lutzii Pb01]
MPQIPPIVSISASEQRPKNVVSVTLREQEEVGLQRGRNAKSRRKSKKQEPSLSQSRACCPGRWMFRDIIGMEEVERGAE